jgi:hypothetical protein
LETPLHHHSCSRVEVQLANNSQRQENTASHHLETPLHHHSCSRVEVQLANNSQRQENTASWRHRCIITAVREWKCNWPTTARECCCIQQVPTPREREQEAIGGQVRTQ